ncbi:hypothetical protein KCU83_g60, partial [Aureobasidium melanogenum]
LSNRLCAQRHERLTRMDNRLDSSMLDGYADTTSRQHFSIPPTLLKTHTKALLQRPAAKARSFNEKRYFCALCNARSSSRHPAFMIASVQTRWLAYLLTKLALGRGLKPENTMGAEADWKNRDCKSLERNRDRKGLEWVKIRRSGRGLRTSRSSRR